MGGYVLTLDFEESGDMDPGWIDPPLGFGCFVAMILLFPLIVGGLVGYFLFHQIEAVALGVFLGFVFESVYAFFHERKLG